MYFSFLTPVFVLQLLSLHWEIRIYVVVSVSIDFLTNSDFLNSVLNKGKSAIPPPFNSPEVLFSASNKQNLFVENFSRSSNIDD